MRTHGTCTSHSCVPSAAYWRRQYERTCSSYLRISLDFSRIFICISCQPFQSHVLSCRCFGNAISHLHATYIISHHCELWIVNFERGAKRWINSTIFHCSNGANEWMSSGCIAMQCKQWAKTNMRNRDLIHWIEFNRIREEVDAWN